jgi:hypothetical protein
MAKGSKLKKEEEDEEEIGVTSDDEHIKCFCFVEKCKI